VPPFLFLCFFSGAKACFKLIGLGVRKSGAPALGEITDFKTGPWKRVVTEAVLSEVTFSQASFRKGGDPCAVLAIYSTVHIQEKQYILFDLLLCINFYI
jgi:hypothetical protein